VLYSAPMAQLYFADESKSANFLPQQSETRLRMQ
jgi:hypothetical protein